MKKVVHTSGTRKRAVARATVKEGKGVVRVNRFLLSNYFKGLYLDKVMEPILLIGDLINKINVYVNVKGGGVNAQAEAVRLAIARAFVEYFKGDVKEKFLGYDRMLLVADTRYTEKSKPNRSKPRARRQTSYR